MDLNHRAFYRSDLQSGAFNHSATHPKTQLNLVDAAGLEPANRSRMKAVLYRLATHL